MTAKEINQPMPKSSGILTATRSRFLAAIGFALLFIVQAGNVSAQAITVTEQSSNIEGANSFGDVHFADSQTGWIAGESMFILHTTDGGVTWIEQPFPIKDGNVGGTNSVHFVDAMNGWVVGHNGTILHTTNGGVGATAEIVGHTANSNGERIIHNPAWNHQTSGVNTFLNSVHFVDANNGWVVGNHGIILHTTNGGATWTSQTTDAVRNALAPGDPAITLESVHFVDAMNGWVVGHNGTILHTINGGTTWTAQTVDDSFTNHLQSVYFVDAMNGWAVGNRTGTSGIQDIIRTTDGGSTWLKSEFDSGVNVLLLNSLHFADAKNGFVVGNSFNFSPYAVRLVILHTTDGGKTWIPQNSIDPHTDPDVQKNLRSVYSIDANNAWAVGSGGTILRLAEKTAVIPTPLVVVPPLELSVERLTVVLGETKEVTISGGLPPYVAPFVSGDLDVVRTSIDGTTLSITGLRVGKADTAQVRLRPRGSASGFGYLQVKVNAPPVLNPEDNDDGSGSKSVFRGGASSDGGETYFKDNAFSAGESLNIVFVITPRRADIGEQANIVVMAKEASAPDTVVLATESGLVSYDGETLFFFKEDITLERNTFINLTPEPITLWPAEVGNYELFIGYQIADGEVLYHAEPLKIEVVL